MGRKVKTDKLGLAWCVRCQVKYHPNIGHQHYDLMQPLCGKKHPVLFRDWIENLRRRK